MKYTNNSLLFVIICFLASVACTDSTTNNDSLSSDTGVSGSMARFTIAGDYLYTVDNSKISAFDLNSPESPSFTSRQTIGFDIETIFPLDSLLFIGSQAGMQILSLKNPQAPTVVGSYQHIQSCDPVVSDGKHAYLTLSSSGIGCLRGVDVLEVLDISKLNDIRLSKSYPMENPKGLTLRDSLLIVCDDGLKVYNKSNSPELSLMFQYLHPEQINFRDVLSYGDNIIAIAPSALYQFSIKPESMRLELLSTIEVTQ